MKQLQQILYVVSFVDKLVCCIENENHVRVDHVVVVVEMMIFEYHQGVLNHEMMFVVVLVLVVVDDDVDVDDDPLTRLEEWAVVSPD